MSFNGHSISNALKREEWPRYCSHFGRRHFGLPKNRRVQYIDTPLAYANTIGPYIMRERMRGNPSISLALSVVHCQWQRARENRNIRNERVSKNRPRILI